MHKLSINTGNIVRMYESGLNMREIAEKLGVSKSFIFTQLKSVGASIRDTRIALPTSVIVDQYLSGVSELKIAKSFGVSRNVIRRYLIEANVDVRCRSEAEKLKWSQMTDEQRSAQVEAAHQAIREKPPEFHARSAILQAVAKQRSLSKSCDMESLFICEFEKLGFAVIPQKACGPYNIDIAIGGAAIEIHANSAHPHTHSYYRKRVVDLLKSGWDVYYIKCTGQIDAKRAAQKISEMINLVESNKSGARHYGVIRGSGEFVAAGCLDGDDLSRVSRFDTAFDAVAR